MFGFYIYRETLMPRIESKNMSSEKQKENMYTVFQFK